MSLALDPAGAGYSYGYLDADTKRHIRRALLKAIAIPGHQVPFASRELPIAQGWGTGGIQITASLIGPQDRLKVIDQGADDTVNAVSIRRFFARMCGVETTTDTTAATLIQSRHRLPETPLTEGQIIVYQVPIPEPLRWLEPRTAETLRRHGYAEYGAMHVRLYEDVARYGEIATSYDYPVMVGGRYLSSPSPIPKYDTPRLNRLPALQLFGAGRERRIYAIPPYTDVKPLGFSDHPFTIVLPDQPCALCGAKGIYLDELIVDDEGGRRYICSDTDHCLRRREAGYGP